MAKNPFDTLGMYSDSELSGIGSKLKKAVKKVSRVAEKRVTTVRDKVLPKRVAKELSRAAKNPVVRGAALAVAGTFAAPLIMGGGAGISASSVASTVAKSAAKTTVKTAIGKKLSKDAQRRAAASARKNATVAKAKIDTKNVAANAKEIAQAPEMMDLVNTLKEGGATPKQVLATWTGSDLYKDAATMNAADAVYPQLYEQFIASGADPATAQALATDTAIKVGSDAAETVAKDSGGANYKFLAVAIPVAAALFFGA